MKWNNIISICICIILFLGFGCMVGIWQKPKERIITQIDTLYVFDTLTYYVPIETIKEVVRKEYIPITDTICKHDTTYIVLDREKITWRDSLSVIYASGINASIDSVRHFLTKEYIYTTTEKTTFKKPRFSLGFQAGYGAMGTHLQPYIGLGLSYNITSF